MHYHLRQNSLSIGISGTHGSGKTTLTTLLGSVLNLLVINESRPGKVAKEMGYAKPSEVPSHRMKQFQWLGLIEQIAQERELLEKSLWLDEQYERGFVTDRTTVDFVAYYDLQIPEEDQDTAYYGIARNHARTAYDLLIVLPPNSLTPPENNGVRHTSDPMPIYTKIMGELEILNFNPNKRVEIMHVTTDTPEDRIQEVLEHLIKLKLIKGCN